MFPLKPHLENQGRGWTQQSFHPKYVEIILLYEIHVNTNEIPGELSRENMISSHVKITRYLHL